MPLPLRRGTQMTFSLEASASKYFSYKLANSHYPIYLVMICNFIISLVSGLFDLVFSCSIFNDDRI